MPARTGDRLLLLGASARALAQSAIRSSEARRLFPGGLVALDFFADADLDGEPIQLLSVARDAGLGRTVASLGRQALRIEWQGFLAAGGLENRPGLLRLLERRGRPLGSAAAAVRAVRNPERLATWLAGARLPQAPVVAAARVPADGRTFLLKPRRGAGGGHLRLARPGELVPPGWYLQQYLEGRAGSAGFLADGRAARLLGVSAQLSGWEALGGAGFRHSGNLFDASAPLAGPDRLLDAAGIDEARGIASGLAEGFGLSGLAGFDFIAVGGRPHLIEVNPRWTASMELYDEARPGRLVDAAIRVAAGEGAAPAAAASGFDTTPEPPGRPAVRARGVLYAAETFIAPPPEALAVHGARDRPRAGETIEAGKPICTLAASGPTVDAARAAIEAAAVRVRALGLPIRTAPAPAAAPERGRD